jgi:hypothetical protein
MGDRSDPPGSARKAFISSAAEDWPVAVRLAEILRDQGVETFVAPQKLPSGEDNVSRLRSEITEADTFVMVRSAAAATSNAVQMELGAAWGADKPIVFVIPPGQNGALDVRMPRDFAAASVFRMDGLSDEAVGTAVREGIVGLGSSKVGR